MIKMCTACKIKKPITDFHKNKNLPMGVQDWCKPCKKQAGYERYLRNRDRLLNANKKYQTDNPEKSKAQQKAWRQSNKSRVNAKTAKRRATKLQASPPWLTSEHKAQIAEFYEMAKELEKVFPWPQHVDHIEPLQGKDVCGLHVPWNLQILSAKANLEKGNR
jgi:hypothetical protein